MRGTRLCTACAAGAAVGLTALAACSAARTGVLAGGVVPVNDVLREAYSAGWEGRMFIDYATPVVPVGLRSGISYFWMDDAGEERRNLNAFGATAGIHYTFPVTESWRPYIVAETAFYYTTNGAIEGSAGFRTRHEKSANPGYSLGLGLDMLKNHQLLLEGRLTWMCCLAVDRADDVRGGVAVPISIGFRF
jgi:hypothetical protein